MQELNIEYHGANISARVDNLTTPTDNGGTYPVSLLINGLQRDKGHLKPASGRIKLSSPVQTDYEWHEIIEAIFVLKDNELTLSVTANQQPLSRQAFKP